VVEKRGGEGLQRQVGGEDGLRGERDDGQLDAGLAFQARQAVDERAFVFGRQEVGEIVDGGAEV
jgi:hypothetical protein